jgi:glycopeptide antibiotics resistance protein
MDSLYRTDSGTGTAINTKTGINVILSIPFRYCLYRTYRSTGTAFDTFRVNIICHVSSLLFLVSQPYHKYTPKYPAASVIKIIVFIGDL